MSLLDTIKGAAAEASANEKAATTSKDKEAAKAKSKDKSKDKKADSSTKRTMRGSAASAKPKREAASSVREASKPAKKELTKEEKKAQRAKQREEDDLRATVTQILLTKDEAYQRTERIWWILIGGGFVCTLISAVINYSLAPNDTTGVWAIVGIVLIALAYILIIGSFIYGMVMRSKKRKPIEARVASMNERKMTQIVEEDYAERAAKKAEKEAAKAAKKAEKEAAKAAKKAGAADAASDATAEAKEE